MGNPAANPPSVVPDNAFVTTLLSFADVHPKVWENGATDAEGIRHKLVSISFEGTFISTSKIAALVLQIQLEEKEQGAAAAICSPETAIL